MKTLRFGIEIETVGLSREKLARAIHSVVGGMVAADDYRSWRIIDTHRRTWRVVPDGSLSGGENSGEIVSPVLSYEDIEELQNVVRAVRQAGARADSSTGIHIHIDGSRFDAKSVTNLVKVIHKQERLLEHALGVSDARRSRYCRPINEAFIQRLEARRPTTMQEVSDAWYGYRNTSPQRYDQSRYHGLNLNSLFFRGTIEFRYYAEHRIMRSTAALMPRSSPSKRLEGKAMPGQLRIIRRSWVGPSRGHWNIEQLVPDAPRACSNGTR